MLYGSIKTAEERICKLCNQNNVEDEDHILHHCTKYTIDREILYGKAKEEYDRFLHLLDTILIMPNTLKELTMLDLVL